MILTRGSFTQWGKGTHKKTYKHKARRIVVGREEKSLPCDRGSEVSNPNLNMEREKKRVKKINGRERERRG